MNKFLLILLFLAFCLQSCDGIFGKKNDEQVEEVFEDGAIDPNLNPENVGYVPILPLWKGFDQPKDVYVGYDEMVYVVDNAGLKILDQKGQLFRTIPIQGATEVIQDRRLHTYVIGTVDYDLCNDGMTETVAAVYHLKNTALGSGPVFLDTLIHPLNDVTRNSTCFRGADDLAVEFTGLATLHDNTLLVSRRGPRNVLSSIARPDNSVLIFDPAGNNISYCNGLNPVTSSLKSVLDVAGIAGFAAPPQSSSGVSESQEFVLIQGRASAEYKALWITRYEDPDAGVVYAENAELAFQDPEKADRFLYEPNRFVDPTDIFVAPDFTGYIFVVDAGLDSLYQFTRKGYEGVNPPATSSSSKQIIASFGGSGSGPFQFIDPSGVCYHERTVYVADKGNNRISRFKLSTDLE